MVSSLQKLVLAGLCLVTQMNLCGQPTPSGMAQIPYGLFHPLYRSVTDLAEVPVKGFYLDVLPVTNQEFLEFVRANPRWQRSKVKRLFADESYLKLWACDLEPGID